MQIQQIMAYIMAVVFLCAASLVQAGGNYRVEAVNNQLYQDDCGFCHFAYQPGLLPTRSWRKVMGNLADHFGENAELDETDRQALLTYLEKNSADNSSSYLSRKVMRSLTRKGAVIQISKLGFMAHEHDEIPRRVFTGDLQGLTNCNACHQQAEQGSYNERDIKIPGYGRWDD